MPYKTLPTGGRIADYLTDEEHAEYLAKLEARGDIGAAIAPRFIKARPRDLVTTRRQAIPNPEDPGKSDLDLESKKGG